LCQVWIHIRKKLIIGNTPCICVIVPRVLKFLHVTKLVLGEAPLTIDTNLYYMYSVRTAQ